MFSGVMNHGSLFGSPMDESEFGERQENAAYRRDWWRRDNGLGLLFRVWTP